MDGEGGYCVRGKLMPAAESVRLGGLPIGLAHGVKLVNSVPIGQPILWADVAYDPKDATVQFRRAMKQRFASKE